jgi:hypothetical protein
VLPTKTPENTANPDDYTSEPDQAGTFAALRKCRSGQGN